MLDRSGDERVQGPFPGSQPSFGRVGTARDMALEQPVAAHVVPHTSSSGRHSGIEGSQGP